MYCVGCGGNITHVAVHAVHTPHRPFNRESGPHSNDQKIPLPLDS